MYVFTPTTGPYVAVINKYSDAEAYKNTCRSLW